MNINEISKFVPAGKSTFTIKNTKTGNRFTFRVSAVKDEEKDNASKWFVSVLSGSDNEASYSYMGLMDNTGFHTTKKSKVGQDAVSFKAFCWFHRQMVSRTELPENVEFYHAGKCGRCGRTLTTPESVSLGIGPECIKKVK